MTPFGVFLFSVIAVETSRGPGLCEVPLSFGRDVDAR